MQASCLTREPLHCYMIQLFQAEQRLLPLAPGVEKDQRKLGEDIVKASLLEFLVRRKRFSEQHP